MINAIIEREGKETVILGLNQTGGAIYDELRRAGIEKSINRIYLSDEENDVLRVKLYSEEKLGNALISLLTEKDTLYDAYLLENAVKEIPSAVKAAMEDNLLRGEYQTPNDFYEGLRELKIEMSPIRQTFFCSLEGNMVEEEYGPEYEVDGHTMLSYQESIEDALKDYQSPDLNMALYLGRDAGITDKLVLAEWEVEEKNGKLYGRIDCYLTDAITVEETKKLKDAIDGQNSDGFGEGFAQDGIRTEDGRLYVSFWSFTNDFLLTEEEMEGYLHQNNIRQGGM